MLSSSRSYLPLGLVFLSGIGFSIQSLFIKILSESGFSGSFQLLFLRGSCQLLVSSIFVYRNVLRGEKTKLFGNNSSSIKLLVVSSLLEYGGQALVFTSIEYVPVDFALVLDRQSVVFQAILAYVVLGEPWFLIEIISTFLSILGVVLISQPKFLILLFASFGNFLGVSSVGEGVVGDENENETGPSENGFGLDENAMTLSDGDDLDKIGVMYGLLAAFLTACAYVTIRMTGPSRVRYASSQSYCSLLVPADDTSIPCPNVVFAASISQLLLSIPCMMLSTKEEFDLALSYSGWALLIGVAVIGTWSQLALTAGLQYEKASRTGVIRTSNVICGIFWQALSTGVSPDGLTITGVVMVAIGSLLILMDKNYSELIYTMFRYCKCWCCTSEVQYKPCCPGVFSGCLERKGKDEQYEKVDTSDDISALAFEHMSNPNDADSNLELFDKIGVRSRSVI